MTEPTQYVALVGNYDQYRQWRKNWRISYKFDIVEWDPAWQQLIEDMESFSLIIFESWFNSDTYDVQVTSWLLDKAVSTYHTSELCPVVERGKIVAWRKKGAWKVEKKEPLTVYGTRLSRLEEKKLKKVIKYLSKSSGEATASGALRYALEKLEIV